MTNLPDILNDALSRIEPQTEARMDTLIAEFAAFPLSGEDRLSALAGTIAAIAHTRYVRHRETFLEALRGWALEIANSDDRLPALSGAPGGPGGIRDAQDLLLGGIDTLLRSMLERQTTPQHRLVAELALLARLLGINDAATIHLVITTVGRTLHDPMWRCGERVAVVLSEQTMLLSRDAAIDRVAPRGTA